jgi:pyruvate dehydrogenase E2 component (dihydrolipoamide acetyltransferase)
MPAMSPTMTEGGIASWKKKEGESFSMGDVLLEIETDKATIDVEAQDDGIMAKILVPEGSKNVAVGSTIAVLAEEGDDLSKAGEFVSQTSSSAKGSESKEPEPSKSDPEPKKAEQSDSKISESTPQKSESPKSDLPAGDRIFASPIAKKIALERGIPLAKIKGSGPEGRIIREDVEKYKAPATETASVPTPSKQVSATSAPATGSSEDYVDTPVSNMRRTIGSRLLQSKQEIPHYYVTVDINMDKALKLREVFNQTLTEKDKSAKLSVNDFIVKAVACALADVPEANSAWMGEVIRQYKKSGHLCRSCHAHRSHYTNREGCRR